LHSPVGKYTYLDAEEEHLTYTSGWKEKPCFSLLMTSAHRLLVCHKSIGIRWRISRYQLSMHTFT